ncbi:MAG: class I SAM-dependent methyltransferase, partial [Chloroflexia bacterium]
MEKVARYWSEPRDAAFGPENYWAALPAVRRRLNRLTSGQEDCNWINYCLQCYLDGRLPLPYCLSLGCGDGWLERALAAKGVFKQCDALDIAPGAIERAQKKAQEAGWANINYQVADLNTVSLPANRYDAIWMSHSYHHVADVEHLAREIACSLTQEGLFFLCDYVGPVRFHFPPPQRTIIERTLQLLPVSYRRLSPFAQRQEEERARLLARNPTRAISRLYDKIRGGDLWPALWRKVRVFLWSLSGRRKGLVKNKVFLPTPYDVTSVDPSEAIRSDEILPALRRHLEIIEFKPLGGNILHFLLDGIAHNF